MQTVLNQSMNIGYAIQAFLLLYLFGAPKKRVFQDSGVKKNLLFTFFYKMAVGPCNQTKMFYKSSAASSRTSEEFRIFFRKMTELRKKISFFDEKN